MGNGTCFLKKLDCRVDIKMTTKLPALGWNEFFKLRGQKRKINLVSSVATGFVGLVGGAGYFGEKEIDPSQLILGLDPLLVFGAATAGCGAAGWLAGPVLGSSVWRIMLRNRLPEMTARENEFFGHIRRHRVDPSFQSFSNPVPDYYGEKIKSLSGYRRWLKDQRAFRHKAKTYIQ